MQILDNVNLVMKYIYIKSKYVCICFPAITNQVVLSSNIDKHYCICLKNKKLFTDHFTPSLKSVT